MEVTAASEADKTEIQGSNPVGLWRGLGRLALVLLGPIWSAFVFLQLWRWFLLPLGVQNITIWHSLGLVTIAQFLLLNVYPWRENDKRQSNSEPRLDWAYWKGRFWRGNIIEAFYLLVGWIAHYGVHPTH